MTTCPLQKLSLENPQPWYYLSSIWDWGLPTLLLSKIVEGIPWKYVDWSASQNAQEETLEWVSELPNSLTTTLLSRNNTPYQLTRVAVTADLFPQKFATHRWLRTIYRLLVTWRPFFLPFWGRHPEGRICGLMRPYMVLHRSKFQGHGCSYPCEVDPSDYGVWLSHHTHASIAP